MAVVLDWSGWEIDGTAALAPVEPSPAPVLPSPAADAVPPAAPLPMRAASPRKHKLDLDAMAAAFRESCKGGGIVYQVGQDVQGRSRVVLSSMAGGVGGIALWGLKTKLEHEPQLEAALLLELARGNAALQDILTERAAIRAADDLPDDDLTVALLTIGADERPVENKFIDVCVVRGGSHNGAGNFD